MNITISKRFNEFETIKKLRNSVSNLDKGVLYISPLHGASKSFLIKSLIEKKKSILVLLENIGAINETLVELDILGLGSNVIAIKDLTSESIQEKLTDISNKEQFILLATYNILDVNLPDKSTIKKNTTVIELGNEITYDELIEYFNLINYNREKYVTVQGDFSIRGSVIDFWSYSENQPCRLEYDGDFLESMRYFDNDSQRSLNQIKSVTIASKLSQDTIEKTADIFSYLDTPLVIASEYEIENFINNKNGDKNNREIENPEVLNEEIDNKPFGEEEKSEQTDLNKNIVSTKPIKSVEQFFNKNALWLLEDELGQKEPRIDLGISKAPVINSNFELLFNYLLKYSKNDYEIIITAENQLQGQRLLELLSDYKSELRNLIDDGKIQISILAINKGFICKKGKFLILTDYQIFNKPYRQRLLRKYKIKKSRVKDFASIKIGDYVVHENFGIGQYAGLEKIKIGLMEQESIKILYANKDVVYVNLNYLSLIKKFSSKDNVQPRLTTLGNNEWQRAKKKVKSRIKDAARKLIKLYAERKASEGFAFNSNTIWQNELEASFFYEDTPDQAKVTKEVKDDMRSPMPMDRLVCGDVGFGKTEIAVRAAFIAVNDSKQVCVLVPTTILAEQHFNTFCDRLKQFPVNIAQLSRFQKKSEQIEIVKKLANGKIDIVIGTHRLLSKDIKFKDLGLLVIDEEQRFGVMAKEKLRSMKVNVDTLILTATPIPRTLNLSLLGARDLSIITTPPPNRQPIFTKVDKFDPKKIRNWVLTEIKRNGQIYFVHDRVQSIDRITTYMQKYIPEIKIGVAHGQMKPSQLEKVIHEFLNKKYHMLISTKIIESGLDIPNVNTIIINRADRFGLAELHQLRGRVGRSNRQAYAYLLVPSLNTITKKALKRLQAIEEYTDLGEGFNLSMRDLEIRGAGNLLGTEQSGAIDSVGFEIYIKLLDEAVEELKHDEFKNVFKNLPKVQDKTEPTIDTYFKISIPNSYMPDSSDRLSFYSALFSILKIEEIDDIREEMEDKFGKMPIVVERLIMIAVLRFYASYAMFERIVILRNGISIILPSKNKEDFYKNKFTVLMNFIVSDYSGKIRFEQNKNNMKLKMDNEYSSIEEALDFVIKFCKEVITVFDKTQLVKTD